MSKRKPLDKEQLRERRNKLLASAATAELSLTDGVREMRAIAGMTQDEFARHRGVSARVIKALELGQGNPTVATMNRIGQFFGLEVGFVPVRRNAPLVDQPQSVEDLVNKHRADFAELITKAIQEAVEEAAARIGSPVTKDAGEEAVPARTKRKPHSS